MGSLGRLRWGEFAVFAAFASVSCWVLAMNLWLTVRHGDVWSGTDGVAAQDQMQYLAWIRDASEHGLASNLYDLDPTPHDFIQPLVAVSALLTAAGAAPWLTLLLWKPVALVGVYLAVRGFVWASVDRPAERLLALVAALFFTGWGVLVLHMLDSHANAIQWSAVTNELWVPHWMWGYEFGAIAFACMVAAALFYARDRERGAAGWKAPMLGALAAWIHPWQGQVLLVILLASELILRRSGWRLILPTACATAIPLIYYVVLRRTDISWEQTSQAAHRTWPLWIVLLSLLPLALPALLAYRSRPRTVLGAITLAWPPVVIALVFVNQSLGANGVLHALLGLSVPLAVLAVIGLRSVSRRRGPPLAAVVAASLLVVVPPAYEQMKVARKTVKSVYNGKDANFLTAEEDDALEWLRRQPGPGGVLTSPYLGAAVPGRTGRATYVGNSFWTPDFYARAIEFFELLQGQPPHTAQSFVRRTGARFVLTGCPPPIDLSPSLADVLVSQETFGCARVYELRVDPERKTTRH
ncbi:MAG: hypothetical protein JW895_01210 [Thermoleophilaceae bacterium]|nr:hypothetical protein [Thermoleophilaceae bacterium]